MKGQTNDNPSEIMSDEIVLQVSSYLDANNLGDSEYGNNHQQLVASCSDSSSAPYSTSEGETDRTCSPTNSSSSSSSYDNDVFNDGSKDINQMNDNDIIRNTMLNLHSKINNPKKCSENSLSNNKLNTASVLPRKITDESQKEQFSTASIKRINEFIDKKENTSKVPSNYYISHFGTLPKPLENAREWLMVKKHLLPRTRDLLRTGLVVLGSSLILLAIFLIVHLQNIPKEYSNSHFNLPSDDKFRPHLSDDAPELHENSHVSADPKGVMLPYVYRSYSEMEKDRMMKLRQLPSYRGKSGVEKVLKLVKDSVEKERLKIKDTEPNLWKEGQTSLRILFVSTWRSASTFLGQVLQEHPGVFQHYEPFSYLGVKQIRSGAEAFQSQQNLHKLLDCRYEGLDRYLNYTKFNPADMSGHNKRIWKACKDTQRIDLCSSPDFLAKTCSMFPIQLVKTVRLRLNLTQLFLGESRLKAKIIYLVRDPRATMSSRRSTVKWCQLSEDCSSAQVLCDDLKADLKVSAALARLFPDNFKLVKYEDLANNPVDIVKGIFDFLGLQMTESITDFVKVNTNSDIEKPWSIARKSAARISRWKELLSRTEINEIQSSCGSVIESLGLKLE